MTIHKVTEIIKFLMKNKTSIKLYSITLQTIVDAPIDAAWISDLTESLSKHGFMLGRLQNGSFVITRTESIVATIITNQDIVHATNFVKDLTFSCA